MKDLNIGDKLWNGGFLMLSYEVTAVIKREKNTQYEILCQSCKHSDPCRLLITKDDYKKLVYVGMVNEGDEDEFVDKHYYFHKDNGHFHLTKEEAEVEKVTGYISRCKENIEKGEKQIEYEKKEMEKFEDRLKAYLEVINKGKQND